LQKEINRLKKSNTNKDKEISKLKNDVTELKKKSFVVSKSKIQYKRKVLSSNYTENKNTVPSLVEIKGIKYAPVNLMSDTMGFQTNFNKSKNILYIGINPDGIFLTKAPEDENQSKNESD
jgi:hypothetical protein